MGKMKAAKQAYRDQVSKSRKTRGSARTRPNGSLPRKRRGVVPDAGFDDPVRKMLENVAFRNCASYDLWHSFVAKRGEGQGPFVQVSQRSVAAPQSARAGLR